MKHWAKRLSLRGLLLHLPINNRMLGLCDLHFTGGELETQFLGVLSFLLTEVRQWQS